MKKFLKFVLKLGYDLLIAFCIILIMVIFIQKITENDKSIFGFRIYEVDSENCENVIITKKIDKNDIKIGDSIVYKENNGRFDGKIVMQDVIEIAYDEDENLIFHARDLEDEKNDFTFRPNQICGIFFFESYILTILYEIAKSIYAYVIIIFVVFLNLFISMKSKKRNRRKLEKPSENFIDLSKENEKKNEPNNNLNEEENKISLTPEKVKLIYAKVESLKIKADIEKENRKKIEEEIKRRIKKKQ